MQINPALDANKFATNQSQIVDAEFIRNTLKISRTQFYEYIKVGVLPPASFRVGPKNPRWFWPEVIEHLTRQQSCTADQRADAEVA